MRFDRTLWMLCVGTSIAACGGGGGPSDAATPFDGGRALPDAATTNDAGATYDAGIVGGRCAPEHGAGVGLGRPCDPLEQTCERGGCYFQAPVAFCPFSCVDTSGPGIADGEPCEFLNDCLPGLACLGDVPGCTAENCCTPYCTLGTTCANGATCTSIGLAEPVPTGLEDVGVCIVR